MKRRISVIVLNFNGYELTRKCIVPLFHSKADRIELDVLVVDNGSVDDSISKLEKLQKKLNFSLIKNKENLGWSGGNNRGIKVALRKGAEAVLLLNNDALIKKTDIFKLADELFSAPLTGIVGPKIMSGIKKNVIVNAGNFINKKRYYGTEFANGKIDNNKYESTIETDYIVGVAMMVKSEVFRKVGLFDDRFFLYFEDTDFSFRVKKFGYLCKMVRSARAYHLGEATSRLGSPLHTYYNARNHMLFMKRHAPYLIYIREILRLPKTVFEILSSSNITYRKYSLLGLKDHFFNNYGKKVYW